MSLMVKRALSLFLLLLAAMQLASANENENDQLLKVIDEFCTSPRGTVAQLASRAMKLPYQPRAMTHGKESFYIRGVVLMKLGGVTLLTLAGAKPSAPVSVCEIVSHSQDAVGLVAHLRDRFNLPEPTTSSFDVQLRTSGKATIGDQQLSVKLVYGFEDNKKSGSFTLTIER